MQVLENAYKKQEESWCWQLFGKNKTPPEYAEHLNIESKKHHYERMLGVLLKKVYETGLVTNPSFIVKPITVPKYYTFSSPNGLEEKAHNNRRIK